MRARRLVSLALRRLGSDPVRALMLCLGLSFGVAGVVAVRVLSAAVEQGLHARSREFLGGDLLLEARRPFADVDAIAPDLVPRTARADQRVLSTMARTVSGASRLVEIKAVDVRRGHYPLSGRLVVDPPQAFEALLRDEGVLVAPELASSLGLSRGDRLDLGDARFPVQGQVVAEPDPFTFSLSVGPRVLMSARALERTGLLRTAHRVRYRTMLAFAPRLPARDLTAMKERLRASMPGGDSFMIIETHAQAQPALRDVLAKVEGYLALAALLGLLAASATVARITQTWLDGVRPEIAVLRCLGASPRTVLGLLSAELVLPVAAGSGLGTLLGAWLALVAAQRVPGLSLAPRLDEALSAGAPVGLALGIGVTLLVCLPALTSIWSVSPAAVLRAEAEPIAVPRAVRFGARAAAALAMGLAAWTQTDDVPRALVFTLGVFTLWGVTYLVAAVCLRALGRLARVAVLPTLRHALAAVARPDPRIRASLVLVALGLATVETTALLEQSLAADLGTLVPRGAPSTFLVDVQPDQWAGVERMCRAAGARGLESAKIVMARLSAINGRPIQAHVGERERAAPGKRTGLRWAMTREQRISPSRTLPPDNHIVAGALWSDPAHDEVSVEVEFARTLGIALGDTLRLDVLGVPVDLLVTSLRSVRFKTLALNFLLVAEPGPLDDAPHFRIVSFALPSGAEASLQDRLVRAYPNVSVVRVRELVAQASELLVPVSRALLFLAVTALASGLVLLASALSASQARRVQEVAVLKALGVGPLRLVVLHALEFVLLGSLAALLAGAASLSSALALGRYVLELEALPSLVQAARFGAGAVLVTVLLGLASTLRALRTSPLRVLA